MTDGGGTNPLCVVSFLVCLPWLLYKSRLNKTESKPIRSTSPWSLLPRGSCPVGVSVLTLLSERLQCGSASPHHLAFFSQYLITIIPWVRHKLPCLYIIKHLNEASLWLSRSSLSTVKNLKPGWVVIWEYLENNNKRIQSKQKRRY